MRAIEKSPNGEKVLVIGEFESKKGQNTEKALKVVEKTLIEHALAEGMELVNKSGTRTPVHSISFSGNRAAKEFTGPRMFKPKS